MLQKFACALAVRRRKLCLFGNHLLRQSQLAQTYSRVLKISSALAATSPTSLILKVDIPARLGKAALIFLRLNRIRSSHPINSTIKFRLYTSIVLSRALHACETWKLTASICNTLDVFHRRCIRKILGLSWQDRVTNEELMRRSGTQRDASPIRDSANSEAEIGRSSIKIA